jgi:hypothetical protein
VSEVRAELRTHTRALHALRQTQLEQGVRLPRVETEVREGFATTGAGMARISELLQRMTGEE